MLEHVSPKASRRGALDVALWFLLASVCASWGELANNSGRAGGNPAATASAGATNSNVVIRRVQVSPKLPTYRFVLTRDPAASDTPAGRQPVGRIDIAAGNSPAVLQSIKVEGTDPNWFVGSFHTLDINFDGYLDFAVVNEVGGKWSSDSYWLFDPGSGSYVTNALAAELKALEHNGLKLDPRKQEIRISLFIGDCRNSFEVFRVTNGHLVLMESEIHSPKEPGRCLVKKRKRIDGQMRLIETKEQKHEVQR